MIGQMAEELADALQGDDDHLWERYLDHVEKDLEAALDAVLAGEPMPERTAGPPPPGWLVDHGQADRVRADLLAKLGVATDEGEE